MDGFGSFLGGGGGAGGGKVAASTASATSGNTFGGFVNDQGGLTPLSGLIVAALGLFALLGLVLIAKK